MPQLLLVIPVFNERESVEAVMRHWHHELCVHAPAFHMLVIDDGSNDGTAQVVDRVAGELGRCVEVIHRENRGHGQSCLQGYRLAQQRSVPWVMQVDSDGQCDPRYFRRLWQQRDHADVVYGRRVVRMDGWRRKLASRVLRLALRLLAKVDCVDANTPYRLMRVQALEQALPRIHERFFLANVALAVLMKRQGLREVSVNIRFLPRSGGEPKVPMRKFARRAVELFRQLRTLDPTGPAPAPTLTQRAA